MRFAQPARKVICKKENQESAPQPLSTIESEIEGNKNRFRTSARSKSRGLEFLFLFFCLPHRRSKRDLPLHSLVEGIIRARVVFCPMTRVRWLFFGGFLGTDNRHAFLDLTVWGRSAAGLCPIDGEEDHWEGFVTQGITSLGD